MIKQLQCGLTAIALIAATALTVSPANAQQKSEISLSRQPGIFYMPSHIIEKQKLIEKHAAALGVPGVTTKWLTFSSGGALYAVNSNMGAPAKTRLIRINADTGAVTDVGALPAHQRRVA